MEAKVLAAFLCDRSAYEELRGICDKEDFSDLGGLILEQVEVYYTTDRQALTVDTDLLLSSIGRTHPAMLDSVTRTLSNMDDVSVPNVMSEYVELRLESMARKIAQQLASGRATGDSAALISQWQDLNSRREAALFEGESSRVTSGLDVNEALASLSSDKLVPIYPEQLNAALGGGAPPGTHIVVFARPETGKSMFCINMACNFVKAGKNALYIGNEDPAAALKQRMISNITHMTKAEQELDQEYAQSLVDDSGAHRMVFADLHPGTTHDVRNLVAEHRPDVVLVDQIRNLRTPRNFTKVEALEYVAKEMRNIAKEFNTVVISVTQAGDSADGKLELTMGDVDFSNTGIPATADVMIGIGVTPMLDKVGKRKLSLPKNKLTGDHTSIDVDVRPEYSEVF